ncbi:trichohyalin-like isoform X1 [Pomacea canaliculata]|uniref:trichohyalin-like isoform X1 n=2 Tax=Pomacea canaliculata TaxID=400727 RepID=UPI000D73CB23|nr:trichohyalin-like isoform X1 [Pomacea canaliculata]
MAATFLIGGVDRDSAKKRRRDAYRQDLELQIKERDAARIRERLQDMNVNASGWLDPEKRPERFKPLGGVHWTEQRGVRDSKVKPYHTLFLYGKVPEDGDRRQQTTGQVADQPLITDRSSRPIDSHRVHLDTPAGLRYQPVTYAGSALGAPNNSVDQAYNFFATMNLDNGGGNRSIVQPISIPYVDNRPIIVTGQTGGGEYHGPKFNPFDQKDDMREMRSLLGLSQMEAERARARMERDNEEFHRKLRKELDDERRKLQDQESEARRRMEEMRRQAEERRKEAERQRLEAERLKREAETMPKAEPVKPRPESKTAFYNTINDYKKQLEEERKKIEELLKSPPKKEKEVWDIKVLQRPRIPPTPKSADRAKRENVQIFNDLKHRDFETRQQFLSIFPDIPWTNRRLELQQDALIRQQEAKLRTLASTERTGRMEIEIPPRRAVSRPDWLDRNPTPFPHVLKKRDKLYTSQSWGGDLDRIDRNNQERERIIGNLSSRNEEDVIDELRLRRHRPASAETLTDDTWLRPSSTTEI